MNDSTGAALIGRTIAGKFLIESVIGRGAMGVVYKARQTALDKVVAIKVMHPEHAGDPRNAALFHREAKAASRLDHPNSVRVVDFGQDPNGPLYIAMEYFAGRDLHDLLAEEWPISGSRVADILSQALTAVGAAHDLGVVHRDLKPENILVQHGADEEGAPHDIVKVCDFGIAKFTEPDDPALSRAGPAVTQGIVVGTPYYMSPEQGQGEALDARSDVYSMGIILYQMLTSQVPFEGRSAFDVIIKQVRDDPEPPTKRAPWVDARLEAVCLKAMMKKRGDRYQSAREMRADLRAVLASPLPSPDPPRRASQSAPTWPAPDGDTGAAVPEPAIDPRKKPPRAVRTILLTAIVAVPAVAALLTRSQWNAPSQSNALAQSNALGQSALAQRPFPPSSVPAAGAVVAPAPLRDSIEAVQGVSPAARPATGSTNMPAPKPRARPARPPTPQQAASPPEPPAVAPPVPTEIPPLPSAAASISMPTVPAPALSPSKSPAAQPPPLDPSRARVAWSVTAAGGGASTNEVRRALSRISPAWDACYQNALRIGSERTEGTGMLHLVTDDVGNVVQAHLSGLTLSTVGPCIAQAANVRIGGIDTGAGWADVNLGFRTEPSE